MTPTLITKNTRFSIYKLNCGCTVKIFKNNTTEWVALNSRCPIDHK